MDLPEYPEFRQLVVEDKPLFDGLFREYPPEISEYTFTNLYSWRNAYGFAAAQYRGACILRSKDGFFDPIGCVERRKIIEELMERESDTPWLRLPEATKLLFEGDESVASDPDPANADYVFLASDLVLLQGKRYDGKRNLIRRFKAGYGYEYVTLTAQNAGSFRAFEEEWCSMRGCPDDPGLQSEQEAVGTILTRFGEFGLKGGAIEVDGKTVALAIGERLNPVTLVMHTLKASPRITGLNQAVLNEFLSRESDGFKFVNMEQDLGIEGLRKAKESYHPVKMVRKYTLRPARLLV